MAWCSSVAVLQCYIIIFYKRKKWAKYLVICAFLCNFAAKTETKTEHYDTNSRQRKHED